MVQEVEEDIWGQILQESTRKNVDNVESRTVLVLGDRNSGKSSLLARTHHEDINDVNKGVALTYTFLDVYEDDNDDPVGRIDFWQVEGEPAHADLLRTALTETTVSTALAVIVLDFSHPWTLASSLKKWLDILTQQLRAASSSFKPLEEQMRTYAQAYHEQKRCRYKEPPADAAANKKKKKKTNTAPEDPSLLPPLDDAVLTQNLGIPIVVVCSKCDSVQQLETDFDYNEGIFEYIQQHLRRICLSYGAALIYTSARKDTNCDLLVDYMEHRLFGFEMRQRAQMLEKDTIFIPFGWDSVSKIKLDFDNQKVCKDPEEPFESVVKKPPFLKRGREVVQAVIAAEDDQVFLMKHKASLDTATESEEKQKEKEKGRGGLMATFKGGHASPVTSASASSLAVMDEDDVSSSVSRPSTTPRDNTSAAAAATAPHHPATPPPSAPTAAGAPDAVAEKDILKGFFTSLIVMKGEKGVKPGGVSRNDVRNLGILQKTPSGKKL